MRIRSYVCVDDIGHVVNPLIVDGQVHGGLAQGIAQALYEEAVHDESGTLLSGSFAEYLMPSAADLPSFTTGRTETPATTNPLGVKGVGEAGTIASTPAVVNAVHRRGAPSRGAATSKCHAPQCGSGKPSRPTRHRGRCPMIPSNFDYVAPTTVDEAVAALAQAGEDAKVIAGGQSLMPVLRLRLAAPTALVDLGRIDELRGVREDGDSLVVGAMTTYYGLLGNPLVQQACAAACGRHPTVADPQIRHRGTLGGGICPCGSRG